MNKIATLAADVANLLSDEGYPPMQIDQHETVVELLTGDSDLARFRLYPMLKRHGFSAILNGSSRIVIARGESA